MSVTTAPPTTGRAEHRELRRFLNHLRLQLWWREALLVASISAVIGALVSVAVLMWPSGLNAGASAVVMAAALSVGLAVALVRRPSVVRAARVADRQLAAASQAADAGQPANAAAATDAQALAADQSSNPAAAAQTLEELQSQAAQSQAAETALQKLADVLRPTAAARDVGDALRAGNYDDAASKLNRLAQESDQLSRLSKRELANAMARAALDSARLDPPLAVAEERGARAPK